MSVKIYTTSDVAEMLRVHINTVRSWIRDGKLNAVKVSDKTMRITEEELKSFLEKQSTK
jgi:excisionase family DNA binding protein